LVIKKRCRGALEGLGMGILTGAVAGALIGFASGDDGPEIVFLPLIAEEKHCEVALFLEGPEAYLVCQLERSRQ
jgi:hypothetical protein